MRGYNLHPLRVTFGPRRAQRVGIRAAHPGGSSVASDEIDGAKASLGHGVRLAMIARPPQGAGALTERLSREHNRARADSRSMLKARRVSRPESGERGSRDDADFAFASCERRR